MFTLLSHKNVRENYFFKFVFPMPDEVEGNVSWLLQKLETECCHDGAWVEDKGVVLAFHHESWKEEGSVDPVKKETLLER